MPTKNVSTNKEAYDILDEIISHIQDITDYSQEFRQKTEKTYDKIELAFLKRLLDTITVLENDSILLKEEFHEIQSKVLVDHTGTNEKTIEREEE
ncbi:hypothetical protein SH1V18_11340 [Vallitalea longa]|uniref:Uncharacterized protein n=1 Tax=Vallitalea longa TaxID=2936439 RepID=A0A9W6DFF5_9FIRM|nr:hypothetical protein [Vallitalea longa]GKX28654.1 hypothetical protein SH1V18_11340 [Vallitalea longa]